MGAMSRRKGGRVEREIVNTLKAAGIPAERVPLSGAHGGSFAGDVVVAKRWRSEVKARKTGGGFKQLEKWLGANDMLILKRNNADPMVLLPWDLAKALLLAAIAVGPETKAA
ncbi:MAG: hypothetical protein ACYC2K_10555 [Gemmatimonadales bacterium]